MTVDAHVNDIGTVFEVTVTDENDVARDVSAVTAMHIDFRKPTGTVVTVVASLTTDGTDGKIQYKVPSGSPLLDEVGRWEIQGYVTWDANNIFHTVTGSFNVDRELQDTHS